MFTKTPTAHAIEGAIRRVAGIGPLVDLDALDDAARLVAGATGRNPLPFPVRVGRVAAWQYRSDHDAVRAFEALRHVLGHQCVLTADELAGATTVDEYAAALAAIPDGDPRREATDIGGYCGPVVPGSPAPGVVVHTTCTGNTTILLLSRGFVWDVANHPAHVVVIRHNDDRHHDDPFDERFDALDAPDGLSERVVAVAYLEAF